MGSGNYYKLRRIILEFFHGSSSSSVWMQRKSPERMIGRYGYSYQGLKLFNSTNRDWTAFGTMFNKDRNKEIKVHPVIKAPIPAASNSQSYSFFPYWGRWFLGSLVTFLPFSYEKWVKLRALEGRAEMVVEEVENVAEMVEKVALVAEKMSSEVDELKEDLEKLETLIEPHPLVKPKSESKDH
ncbi:hypothetical protein G4B88_022251 [Cannabis sativa]|uniref:Uncharacterized protein n=1 Tax=Cannabis sativa TaxID=3483 RepID=A0A7J6DKF5_CANSA|nr:hypothetical protein G4B88_022251 [Cannabis sativa]